MLTQPLNEDWTIITNNTNDILGYVSSHYLSDTKQVIAPKPKTRYFISQVPYKEQRDAWLQEFSPEWSIEYLERKRDKQIAGEK